MVMGHIGNGNHSDITKEFVLYDRIAQNIASLVF